MAHIILECRSQNVRTTPLVLKHLKTFLLFIITSYISIKAIIKQSELNKCMRI